MKKAETARKGEDSRVLFLALELGRREWKLGFGTGMGKRPRERVVKAGDVDGLEDEVRRARRRFGLGERVWSVARVPSPEAEDARHLHRELQTLKGDRTRATNRIRALLATQGLLEVELRAGFEEFLEELVLWDGLPLPDQLKARVKREKIVRGEEDLDAATRSRRRENLAGAERRHPALRRLYVR